MSLKRELDQVEELTSRAFGEELGEVDFAALDDLDRDRALKIAREIRFDKDLRPPKPRALIKIKDNIISTSENITIISGASKVGKSRLFAALISGTFKYNSLLDFDFFGFTIDPSPGSAVVYYDTEQSRYDFYNLMVHAYKRLDLSTPPDYFQAYNLRGLPYERRKRIFEETIDKAANDFGGVHAIFNDGIADFCKSPNDESESFDVVSWIEEVAVTYRTPIITTLHLNPGIDSDKMRGHLGSQLERKSESVFTLKRDEDAGGVEIKPKVLRNAGEDVAPMLVKWNRDKHDFQFSETIAKERDPNYKTLLPNELKERIKNTFLDNEEINGAGLRLGLKVAFGIKSNTKISELKEWLLRVNWIDTNGEARNSPKILYRPGRNMREEGTDEPF